MSGYMHVKILEFQPDERYVDDESSGKEMYISVKNLAEDKPFKSVILYYFLLLMFFQC